MITSLIQFCGTDDTCHYELTQEGKKCQFLQFLINTSNFTWRKMPEEVTEEDKRQEASILLSKLCAIGYLIFQKKRPDVSRAVIATDYMNKEPGRSGKTLFVNFIAKFIQAEHIVGMTYLHRPNSLCLMIYRKTLNLIGYFHVLVETG